MASFNKHWKIFFQAGPIELLQNSMLSFYHPKMACYITMSGSQNPLLKLIGYHNLNYWLTTHIFVLTTLLPQDQIISPPRRWQQIKWWSNIFPHMPSDKLFPTITELHSQVTMDGHRELLLPPSPTLNNFGQE